MVAAFQAILEKFDQQGEKTGWTYIRIPKKIAEQLHPGGKQSFRVKGSLDDLAVQSLALLPMGGGDYILPLKAAMRKALKKQKGDRLKVKIEADTQELKINGDLLDCLQDEPAALAFFNGLAPSHQRYFSKWIEDAKTPATRTRRVALCINALAKEWDYGQMIRAGANTTF